MRIQNFLLTCSSLWLLLTGCQMDRGGFYTNLEASAKEGYLYHHVYRVKTPSLLEIYLPIKTIFGESLCEVDGMLSEFVDEERIPVWRKRLQEDPELRKRYMVVEPGTMFRVVTMKIYWNSSSGIARVYAEVLNGPFKGKVINVSIYARSEPKQDDSRILYTDIVEDLGQLSNEELKKKGLLAE